MTAASPRTCRDFSLRTGSLDSRRRRAQRRSQQTRAGCDGRTGRQQRQAAASPAVLVPTLLVVLKAAPSTATTRAAIIRGRRSHIGRHILRMKINLNQAREGKRSEIGKSFSNSLCSACRSMRRGCSFEGSGRTVQERAYAQAPGRFQLPTCPLCSMVPPQHQDERRPLN